MKSLSLAQPHVIVMVGVPGSGKSFFAEKFAETFNAPYASLEKILPFTDNNNDAAAIVLQNQITELLKTRQSIIIEGMMDTRTEREKMSRQARTAGYQTLFVWVQTDPNTTKLRAVKETKNKTNRTLTIDEYERIVKRFTVPNNLEKPIVISGKHTYATQAKVVLKKLSAPRAEITTHTVAPVRAERSRRNNIIVR
ncbi:MAG TPA: zeta toxin family protein [Candidatus Saccharimonadales bacterium]|nr:zeta toxin family protein [Candidatus Saccharimonadales bacterium]